VRQQPARNPIDTAEKYQEIKNKETKKKANTIFNEVRQFAYVLGARERDFIDSTTNTIYTLHTIKEGSDPLFIAKETQEFRKPQLDSSLIKKQSLNPKRRDRSASRSPVGRPGDRPTQAPGRPVGRPCPTKSSSC